MTLRDRFEARYPCPDGMRYAEKENRYVIQSDYDYWFDHDWQIEAHSHQASWEAYQAAIEDAVPKISAKELKLATAMLKDYTDHLACQCCNDWDFPEDWSEVEKADFVRRYHEWNGDPEEFRPDFLVLPDFAVASFLAHLLSNDE